MFAPPQFQMKKEEPTTRPSPQFGLVPCMVSFLWNKISKEENTSGVQNFSLDKFQDFANFLMKEQVEVFDVEVLLQLVEKLMNEFEKSNDSDSENILNSQFKGEKAKEKKGNYFEANREIESLSELYFRTQLVLDELICSIQVESHLSKFKPY